MPALARPIALLWLFGATLSNAQEITLTLTEALRIAQGKSEQVAVAQAGARLARSEQVRARAQRLPQVNGVASYTRTLATQFSGLFDGGEQAPPCAPLSVDPNAAVVDRVAELERFLACGGSASSFFEGDSSSLPFGRTNIWQLGLSFSQALFAGGRIAAQGRLAEAAVQSADIQIDSTNAQFMLDVTQAFFDTALAFRLLEIAQSNLEEATKTLEFVRLGRQVGRTPEFEVLRAEVTQRNQLPELARRRAALEQSALRLRQLLEIPAETPLKLDVDLLSAVLPVPQPFEEKLEAAQPLRVIEERAPVRQANALVRQRQSSLDIARGQRLPSVSIGSDYALFGYPRGLFPTSTNQFRNDWTATVALQVPIFQGGRIRADIAGAEAQLEEAQSQRRLVRELAQLDTHVALDQLRTAEEEWKASSGTIEQAGRALEIARMRYREGISNQLEVDDARLALITARAERAQAARNLQVARATIALLPLLPLSTTPQLPGQPTVPLRSQPGLALPPTFQSTTPFPASGPNFPTRSQTGVTTGVPQTLPNTANPRTGR